MAPLRSAPGGGRTARLAAAVLLLLGGSLLAAPVLEDGDGPAPAVATPRARAVPAADLPAQDAVGRARAVQVLLAERAAAVLARDRAAFLATVDPRATALRTRQAAVFDALGEVPLSTWDYVLSDAPVTPDADLDRRYGAGQWWAPGVALRYALDGFDSRPVVVDHHLTFVRRAGRWLLAADDDFALRGRATPRALWDRGPVMAVRAPGVLVLGHPASADLLRETAALAHEAIPRVTAVWGAWSERVVVLVPHDAQELAGLLGSSADLSRIAAIATAELRGGTGEHDPTGDRVLLHPEAFAGLGERGRRLVLTHELTHVATRRASGPAMPSWLAEGLADVVGWSGLDVPLSIRAADLRRDVRAGQAPEALPSDEDFAGDSPRLSQAYQGAELAVRLIDERHGRPALLRLYREVGARRGVPPDVALEQGLQAQLGTTTAAFTADWRAALQRQLG